ncbi:hypothetical protein [Streptomyces sp. ISL-100]|uniref:hypothetical protein n=1 Tax=Streptomyces sp. ISL-100 TaxID=2819173 RepID=UPI001BE7F701|nr:hypothetical protein [Streptomyces sp. ISL-100]MBT2398538.1 hypothetical protein [Streptomyces sp. ISL-100]
MFKNTSRKLRTVSLLLSTAAVGMAFAASPANAAATPAWETLSQPIAKATSAFLPFDTKNAFATTTEYCSDCTTPTHKLWQKTGEAGETGETWKQLARPTGVGLDTLTGTAPDDLWAIGRTYTFSVNHYDGTKWSPNLSPDAENLAIRDAKAVSRTSLWAVGSTQRSDAPGKKYPTVTHWNGTNWNSIKFPEVEGSLEALDVKSANDIWAVGSRDSGKPANERYQALALHYDGTKWTEVPVPSIPKVGTELGGVINNGPNDVWVSGTTNDGQVTGAKTGAYVTHWDGKSWTRRDIPVTKWAEVSSFANYGGQLYAGLGGLGNTDPKLVRWTGSAWEQVGGLNSPITGVRALTTTADGSLYVNSGYVTFGSGVYYLQRLAPPAAR